VKIRIMGVDVGQIAADWTLDLPSAYGVSVIRKGEKMTLEAALASFVLETSSSRGVHKSRLDGSPGVNKGAQEGERK
jgi:hypothetical protein